MNPASSGKARDWVRASEWIVALALSAVIAGIHVVNLEHAGGLWRDEAAAVRLATMPTFADVWTHLEHESFPLLITISLRAWSAVGFGTDAGLRTFGLLVGLAVLAAVWWNARRFSASPPLVSLLIFGLSPTVIRWGDSMRAYGLAMFFILAALGLIWSVLRAPSKWNVLGALVAAVLAVQAYYQNAFVLAAICLSGFAVAFLRKDYRRGVLVLALALPAAVSLLPYRGVIARAGEWNVLTQTPIGLARIGTVVSEALSAPSPLMFCCWMLALLGGLTAGTILLVRRQSGEPDEQVFAWFLLAVFVSVTIAYCIFLHLLQFPTEVWYYLVWMALAAVTTDALLQRAMQTGWWRIGRIAVVAAAALFLIPSGWTAAKTRMTNLDLAGRRLTQAASADDLVLVHPWFGAASLTRYYHGKAELMTVPPLADMQLQRLDLMKAKLQDADAVRPVLERIESTLRGGGIVWLVGYYPFSDPPVRPPRIPPAGEGPQGWFASPYLTAYGMEVAWFLQQHAVAIASLDIPVQEAVNRLENFPVQSASGWRDGHGD